MSPEFKVVEEAGAGSSVEEAVKARFNDFLSRNAELIKQFGVDTSNVGDRSKLLVLFVAFDNNPNMTEEEANSIHPNGADLMRLFRGEDGRGPSPAAPGASVSEQPKAPEEEQGGGMSMAA